MTFTPSRALQLELELDEARRHGRWLSDEERAARQLELTRQQAALEQQRLHRRKLVVLTVVALLVPPLWPLALALTLYLLFPLTTRRLALATGTSLLVLGGLAAVLITTLVVGLLMLLF
jgi:hypothetical protein